MTSPNLSYKYELFQVKWKAAFFCIPALFFFLSVTFGATSLSAQATQQKEYKVKAAFILNFTRFTEWPDSAFTDLPDILTLCVIGNKDVKNAFQTIQNKTVGNRIINVIYSDSLQCIPTCDAIFITSDYTPRIPSILKKINNLPVLTIAESPGFANKLGCINFVLQKGKLRFEINQKNAKKQGLDVSSRLLRLAIIPGK